MLIFFPSTCRRYFQITWLPVWAMKYAWFFFSLSLSFRSLHNRPFISNTLVSFEIWGEKHFKLVNLKNFIPWRILTFPIGQLPVVLSVKIYHTFPEIAIQWQDFIYFHVPPYTWYVPGILDSWVTTKQIYSALKRVFFWYVLSIMKLKIYITYLGYKEVNKLKKNIYIIYTIY